MGKALRYVGVAWMVFGVLLAVHADISQGLIGAWTFDDGTARDMTGHSDGELKGDAKIVADGFHGMALDLNGADAFVSVPHVDAWDVTAQEYTVSAWAFVRLGKDHSAIAFKGTMVGWGPNFLFRMATVSNTGLTWGACVAGTEGWFATANAYQAGQWVHLAQTADGSIVTAYVNAEIPPATDNGPNPKPVSAPYLTFPDRPIEIGVGRSVGGTVGNDAYLDGLVDEVYLYNRALDLDEIQELASGEIPRGLAVSPRGRLATTWGSLKSR